MFFLENLKVCKEGGFPRELKVCKEGGFPRELEVCKEGGAALGAQGEPKKESRDASASLEGIRAPQKGSNFLPGAPTASQNSPQEAQKTIFNPKYSLL